MSDPDAERKAKAARAKALVSQADLPRTTPPNLLSSIRPYFVKLNNADLLAGEET
jgi:hypothetical protein